MRQEREPIRVLIIPHQPNRNVKTRSQELARFLAAQDEYQVYVLSWRLRQKNHPNPLFQLGYKIQENLESSLIQPKWQLEEGIRWVRLPHILAPYPVSPDFNQEQLRKFVLKNDIQVIISGNTFHFPMPRQRKLLKIYDLVDDYITPGSNPEWKRTRAFVLNELKKADHIMTVSHGLQEKLACLGYTDSMRIPNGVALSAYGSVAPDTTAIRNRFGLQNAFVVSYIGNHSGYHGWWADMEFLLTAFERLHVQVPHSRLLVVGPGESLQSYQQGPPIPGVIFTGAVLPDEIAAYYHVSDIGVLPFTPCAFTDNALPLKIPEYGAARKPVLAPPLEELCTLQLPHVRLVDFDAMLWGNTLIQEAQNPTPWDPNWDRTIAEYDWPRLWQPLDTLLKKRFGVTEPVALR